MDTYSEIGHSILNFLISTFKNIKETFLPVPSKLHYNFSVREIMKVIKGMGLVTVNQPDADLNQLYKILIHETSRVFSDRLCV